VARIASFLTLLGACYVIICLLTYLRQDSLLFYPQPNHPNAIAALESAAWQTDVEATTLHGWRIAAANPRAAPLVLYFGGNAEDVALTALRSPRDANYVYVNYRGYGPNDGKPSEPALTADAVAIYDAAVADIPHNGRVLAMGRSLGSGVAVYLAAKRRIDALVLVTPFDSMVNAARTHYPWLPVNWLLRHRFESDRLAPGILAPALFLIATEDAILPPARGRALARLWGGHAEVREFARGHNDIEQAAGYSSALRAFITRFASRAG
jgi:pimeloyl-ACP methyl ester carboxylesterase